MKTKTGITLTALALSQALTMQSLAGGYQLQTRSISGLGRALSGEAAIVEDASVMASNPAGLLWLEQDRWHVSVGAIYVDTSVDVSGTFNGASTSGDAGQSGVAPYFYAGKNHGKFAYGLALHVPFTQQTDYPNSFLATSLADESDVKVLNLRPSFAWKINDKLAIGASIDIYSAEGTIGSSIPGAGSLIRLEGDDTAIGGSLGLMWQATEKTRFGFQYRSKVDLSLEGESTSTIPSFAAFNTGVSMGITLPENAEFSIYHKVDDKLAIHADALWVRWSRFQTLAPKLSNGAPVPAEVQNWSNVWRLSVGATYRHSDSWTLRAGVAWDETPINDSNRGLRNPGNDAIWLSCGATYHHKNAWSLDMGYTYIMADDAQLNVTGSTGVFAGKSESSVNVFGLQWNTQF